MTPSRVIARAARRKAETLLANDAGSLKKNWFVNWPWRKLENASAELIRHEHREE